MVKKTKENETKNIFHNYIILAFVCLVCIGFTLYLCEIYKVNDEEKKKTPVIDGILLEIYKDDLDHYVMDNPSAIIYMCTANDDVCRNFEKDFKKLLRKKDYRNQIIYLNLTDIDQDVFVNDFNGRYHYKNKLTTNYPAFVLFEDGEVKSILQEKNNKTLKISKVKQFLELNEIGE